MLSFQLIIVQPPITLALNSFACVCFLPLHTMQLDSKGSGTFSSAITWVRVALLAGVITGNPCPGSKELGLFYQKDRE